jgi:hypothetical protein
MAALPSRMRVSTEIINISIPPSLALGRFRKGSQ